MGPPNAVQQVEDLNLECIKNAVKLVLDNEVKTSKISDESLKGRILKLDSLITEAASCVNDCAEPEDNDLLEETLAAKEAVQEACVAFSDLIDDLRQEEERKIILSVEGGPK